MNEVKVINYHFVRPIKKSNYPNVKGLELELFKNQIQFLKLNYEFISVDDLIDAFYNNITVPSNSVLLTFDDGFIDHYTYVFPLLKRYKINGLFYPPSKPIMDGTILDVHKIQFIIASVLDENDIMEFLFELLNQNRKKYNLDKNENYYKMYARSNRWDNKNIRFIKNMLQYVLPFKLRTIITDKLFKQFVTSDKMSFSKSLYLQLDQMKDMVSYDMHFGSHGHSHHKMGYLSKVEQDKEIKKSLKLLRLIGQSFNHLTISFPYGNYDENTIRLSRENNFKLGFTTEVKTLKVSKYDPLKIPRLDTNDFKNFFL